MRVRMNWTYSNAPPLYEAQIEGQIGVVKLPVPPIRRHGEQPAFSRRIRALRRVDLRVPQQPPGRHRCRSSQEIHRARLLTRTRCPDFRARFQTQQNQQTEPHNSPVPRNSGERAWHRLSGLSARRLRRPATAPCRSRRQFSRQRRSRSARRARRGLRRGCGECWWGYSPQRARAAMECDGLQQVGLCFQIQPVTQWPAK